MRFHLACAGLVSLCVAAAPAAAAAQDCLPPGGYPGDDAADPALATWLARGAEARNLPGELPVMGALVESSLRNLDTGDSDSAGFFQMRTSIWDSGEYAGFPERPELQLEWFVDQADAVRGDHGSDPDRYGEWVADVLRPPAQYRGRYQERLGEARSLIRPACEGAPPGQGPGGGMVVPDVTPPVLALARTAFRRRALVVRVGCADEPCTLTVSARVVVRSGVARAYRLSSAPTTLPAGGSKKVRLRFKPRLLRALAGGRAARARLRVRAVDAAGNASVLHRALRLRP